MPSSAAFCSSLARSGPSPAKMRYEFGPFGTRKRFEHVGGALPGLKLGAKQSGGCLRWNVPHAPDGAPIYPCRLLSPPRIVHRCGGQRDAMRLSEYPSDFKYSTPPVEETLPLVKGKSSVFDQEILVQARHLDFVIVDVPVATKYVPEASKASFVDSTIYGLSILLLLARYFVHKVCHIELHQFQSFQTRYRRVQ